MHRLMMTSAAYRRASSPEVDAFAKDPGNTLLWRMNRRRLEGEAIRDTILAVSNALNPAMGGPGVYAPLPKVVNVEFPNNDKGLSWGTASAEEGRRGSIYLFQRHPYRQKSGLDIRQSTKAGQTGYSRRSRLLPSGFSHQIPITESTKNWPKSRNSVRMSGRHIWR